MIDRKQMTRAEKEAVIEYVREIGNQLHLKDWEFVVYFKAPIDKEDPEFEWGAQADCIPGRKHCEVSFGFDVRYLEPEEFRQTVTHELLHCHFTALWHQPRQDLSKRLSQDTYDVFMGSYERNLEYAVDALADVLAPQMPFIRWPVKSGDNE